MHNIFTVFIFRSSIIFACVTFLFTPQGNAKHQVRDDEVSYFSKSTRKAIPKTEHKEKTENKNTLKSLKIKGKKAGKEKSQEKKKADEKKGKITDKVKKAQKYPKYAAMKINKKAASTNSVKRKLLSGSGRNFVPGVLFFKSQGKFRTLKKHFIDVSQLSNIQKKKLFKLTHKKITTKVKIILFCLTGLGFDNLNIFLTRLLHPRKNNSFYLGYLR